VVIPFVAARGEVNCKTSPFLRRNSSDGGNFSVELTRTSDGDVHNSISGINDEPGRTSSERSSIERSLSGMSDNSSTWDNRLFLAGFGNKMTDAIAYEMAGLDRGDIYIIDTESKILCIGVNEGVSVTGDDDEKICEPADESLSRIDCCVDPLEYSFVEVVCCPGGVEKQILSEMSAPIQIDHGMALSTASNVTSYAIHSSELSTTDCRQRQSRDIDVINDADCGEKSTSSGRSKRRPSIRAFSSKIPFKTFPSFNKFSSSMAKKPSNQKFYIGYGDPILLERIRGRMA
jgi:hypothetical protein